MHASAGHYIYREYDRVSGIYFLHKGIAGYALQKYKSIYILIEAGDMFGVVDTASDVLEESFESESQQQSSVTSSRSEDSESNSDPEDIP